MIDLGAPRRRLLSESTVRQRVYAKYRSRSGRPSAGDDRLARAPYLWRLIRQHFPADLNSSILDAGCGSGALLHFLREAGYRNVRGVDICADQVTAAGQFGIADIECDDLLRVLEGLDAETLDVVVSFDVIEHMTKPELLTFADQVYRVLRRGGRWLIHVPNGGALFGARVRYADWTHEQAFTCESLQQIVNVAGFAVFQCYEDKPVVHGLTSAFRRIVWEVVRSLLRIVWASETGSLGRECIFTQNLLGVATK